jgi:intermembrane space import and assembly protein 40
MFRTAPRALARQSALRALPRTSNAALPAGRRALSTAPPAQKSRSWKNLFARLGAAGAVIYYYNTTDVFGDEAPRTSDNPTQASSEQRAANRDMVTW